MKLPILFACSIAMCCAADWGAPVEVQHEMKPCVTYRARIDGGVLTVRADVAPGWHTFAMDNEKRAAEKLAGKRSLGVDQPTRIVPAAPAEISGAWRQTDPKDMSKPEIRWYSFGYEGQAFFSAPVRLSGSGPVELHIRGQACTDSTCRNVDVKLVAPVSPAGPAPVATDSLVQVR